MANANDNTWPYVRDDPPPIDPKLVPFLPSQADGVKNCLGGIAEHAGLPVDDVIAGAWPQILVAAQEAEFDIEMEAWWPAAQRKRNRAWQTLRRMKAVPGRDLPAELHDIIGYNAFRAGIDMEARYVQDLTADEVARARDKVFDDKPANNLERFLDRDRGGNPGSEAVTVYLIRVCKIYEQITGKTPGYRDDDISGEVYGPGISFLQACLAPLYELTDAAGTRLLKRMTNGALKKRIQRLRERMKAPEPVIHENPTLIDDWDE